MTKCSIAFCTDGIYPLATGGMQKHSRLLIQELALDPELELTVLHPHKQKLFDSPNITEIFITPINESNNYLIECYNYSKRIAEELETLNPTIIYSQGLCVWSKINKFKNKLIINPHGLEPYQGLGFKHKLLAIPFKLVFNFLFNKAAYVVSLGGKLTAILQHVIHRHEKIVVLPNAIDLPKVNFRRQEKHLPIKVLFLARFATNKGIDILFEAIESLNKKGESENFLFTLGGKGPLYDFYQNKNTHSNVKLLGFVPDEAINDLYKDNDLFVLPTLFEGMPTVVLEAMSWKMPVIVSNVGATAELVNQDNGYLINRSNVDELVNSFLKFKQLSWPQTQLMQENSYQRVKEKFTWNAVARAHKSLFLRLMSVQKT